MQGRCTSKAEMRRWSGIKGEGKLFSFDLLDAQV
jgi:ssDNA-binding replication factor A large subunit